MKRANASLPRRRDGRIRQSDAPAAFVMNATFKYQRRIAFSETDMAGIAHFTTYLKCMEETEHAFLRSRGLSASLNDAKGTLGFPKLSARCDFARSTRYDDVLDIDALVSCSDGKSVTYECHFFKEGSEVASGELRVALCRFKPGRPPYAVPIPDSVLQAMFGDQDSNP